MDCSVDVKQISLICIALSQIILFLYGIDYSAVDCTATTYEHNGGLLCYENMQDCTATFDYISTLDYHGTVNCNGAADCVATLYNPNCSQP